MDWEDKWKKLEYEQKERLQQFNMNMRAVDYNGDGLPDNGTPDKVQIGTDVNGNAIYGTATAAGAGSVGAGASGKLSQNDKDKTTVNGGHLLGASATFPIKREKKEILEEYKNSLSGVISNGIYSDTGVAAVLRSLPGVTHTDVTRAINRMQNFNLGTASRSSKDEIDSYQKVIDGLRKEGIDIPAYHGAVGARNAILAYTAKYFDSKLKDPAYKFTDDDAQVARNYIAAKEAMSELDHLNSLQTQQRDKLLAQDKYKVLRRADGTMIDPDEKVSADLIRKEIGNDSRIQFALGNKSNGSYHNYDLSGNELAEAFKNGKFKVLGKGNFEFNGQVVRLADYAYADVDTNAKANPAAANTKKILTRLHEIESGAQRDKYKALIDEVDDQVSEAVLPKHMDNGEMGWTISYKTSNKWSDERGQLLAEEILQPGNRGKVYYADGRINTKTGLINDLSKLSGEELEKVIGENVNYLTKGPGGKPAIQLTISSSLPEKHPFKSSAGETLIFEIDSTKSGKALKQLTQSSDLYIYGKLLRGEELHEDPVMKASGFSYSAIPTRDGRNVTINMDKRTYVLDKDGKGTWEPKTQSFTVSLDQMNPDEIGTMLSQAFIQHVDYNAQQQKLEAEKAKRAGTVDANGQPVKKLKWSDLIK